MKLKSLSLLVMTVLAAPVLVQAADSPHSFTGNVSLTSDYVFRGVSQTQNGPAIQGGFDYSHKSGFYVGTWASNVAWVNEGGYKDDSSMEIDLYGGFRGSMGPVGYDLGLITYYYPGDDIAGVKSPDTTEVYVGASWEFLSLKYSHVVSSNFIGWYDYANSKSSRNSKYLELNATHDLGGGWGVLGHVGHQWVNNISDANYTDWKLGVTKDIGFGVVTLAYSDTNADEAFYTIAGEEIADGRVFVSFSRAF